MIFPQEIKLRLSVRILGEPRFLQILRIVPRPQRMMGSGAGVYGSTGMIGSNVR